MANHSYKQLEQKIDELIQLCNQLNNENGSLKNETRDLRGEREALIKKNALACKKVEQVIEKLKLMEQNP